MVEGREEHTRAKVSQAPARAPQAVGEAISEAGRHQQQRTRSRRRGKRARNGPWAQGSRVRAGSAPLSRAPRRRALAPAAPLRQLRSREKSGFAVNGEATFFRPRACPASPGRKVDLRCGRCHAGRTLQKERATCVDAEISLLMRKALKTSDPRTQRPGLTSGGGQTYWEAGEKCSGAVPRRTSSTGLVETR